MMEVSRGGVGEMMTTEKKDTKKGLYHKCITEGRHGNVLEGIEG